MENVRNRIAVLESYIQDTLEQMQRTLDNREWMAYHERYLAYKMEIRKLKKELH